MEKRLLLYLLIGCVLAAELEESKAAKTRHYNFEVSYIYWSPDCEEGMMIGINGRFPGPTIRAKAGDTIVVKLKNSLPTEGVVIHWHGIKQVCFCGLSKSSLFSCGLCQNALITYIKISFFLRIEVFY